MTNRRSAFISIVDDAYDEDIDKITAYCNYCESLGFYHKLGPKIYPNNKDQQQAIPHDSDNWLQCYNYGQITPKVHAKQQNEIAPIVDPPKNIHDSNNKVVALATK
jgi:hypothetical protein